MELVRLSFARFGGAFPKGLQGRLNGLFMAVTGIRRGAIVLIPVNVVLIALLTVLREKSGWGEFVNFLRHL